MTETINGLHSCKPGNEPIVGEVKNLLVENKTSKKGKSYLKIKSATPEYGGRPYRIVSAEQTDFVDPHGNLSFNLEVEPQNGSQTPQNAPQRAFTPNGGEDRSSRIERQHSQEMALRYFALAGKVPNTTSLRNMTSWFARDIGNPSTPVADDPPVPLEPMPDDDDGGVPF